MVRADAQRVAQPAGLLRDDLFEKDAIVFDELQSRSVEYGAPDSGSIQVEFPGMPHQDWTLLVQDVDKWDADVAVGLTGPDGRRVPSLNAFSCASI